MGVIEVARPSKAFRKALLQFREERSDVLAEVEVREKGPKFIMLHEDRERVLQYLQNTGFNDRDGKHYTLDSLQTRHVIVAWEYYHIVTKVLNDIPSGQRIAAKDMAGFKVPIEVPTDDESSGTEVDEDSDAEAHSQPTSLVTAKDRDRIYDYPAYKWIRRFSMVFIPTLTVSEGQRTVASEGRDFSRTKRRKVDSQSETPLPGESQASICTLQTVNTYQESQFNSQGISGDLGTMHLDTPDPYL